MSKKKSKPPVAPETLQLPCTGVETHAHLDMEPFAQDLDAVLRRARDCGVAEIGQVFLGPTAYQQGRERFAPHPQVFFLLGIHPHDAAGCDAAALEAMSEAFTGDSRLRALGEIGLDYYWLHAPREVQQEALRRQLDLALRLELPVVLHCRDAEEDSLAILDAMGLPGRPLLWHCFGGDAALATAIVERGWHLSIPGPVTFPKNQQLREAVAVVPLERLVLETDCPYLAPEPYRGKRNEPALLGFTAAAVAACKGLEPAALWTACGDTARKFFGLPER